MHNPSFAAVLQVEVDAVHVAAGIPQRAVPDVVGRAVVRDALRVNRVIAVDVAHARTRRGQWVEPRFEVLAPVVIDRLQKPAVVHHDAPVLRLVSNLNSPARISPRRGPKLELQITPRFETLDVQAEELTSIRGLRDLRRKHGAVSVDTFPGVPRRNAFAPSAPERTRRYAHRPAFGTRAPASPSPASAPCSSRRPQPGSRHRLVHCGSLFPGERQKRRPHVRFVEHPKRYERLLYSRSVVPHRRREYDRHQRLDRAIVDVACTA